MSSIWQQTCAIAPRESLQGDAETEIAVIGGGLAGVLIADALQDAGHRVLVLEADRVGAGQTGCTTAKITSQHGLIYEKLIRALGRERAQQYAHLNQTAVTAYGELIRQRNIRCDFESRSSYVYGSDPVQLRAEAEAAASLGLPAEYTEEIPRPIPALAAVRFTGQAQFHPLLFLRALAEGLDIREKTRVVDVEDHTLITNLGRVRAEKIVFACHYPFLNFPGLYFARMHQERSYVIALKNAEPRRACGSAPIRAAIPSAPGATRCCWAAAATARGRTPGADGTTICGTGRQTGSTKNGMCQRKHILHA